MIDYTAAARAEAEEAKTREILAYLAELEAMSKRAELADNAGDSDDRHD
jgi:hypothetical protein